MLYVFVHFCYPSVGQSAPVWVGDLCSDAAEITLAYLTNRFRHTPRHDRPTAQDTPGPLAAPNSLLYIVRADFTNRCCICPYSRRIGFATQMVTFKMLRNMFLLLLLVHFSESVCLSSGSTCSNAAGPTGFDCSSSLRMGGNNYCCCNNLRLYCSSSSDCGTTAPTTYGTFSVVVQRATNLPDTDGYYDTIDPRVKVTLTDPDSEALVQTCGETPVIDDTENPTWNYFISCSGCLDKRTNLNLDMYDFEYNYFSSNSESRVGG
eukprot:1561723-Pleurochrysis_carterae.AAC.2